MVIIQQQTAPVLLQQNVTMCSKITGCILIITNFSAMILGAGCGVIGGILHWGQGAMSKWWSSSGNVEFSSVSKPDEPAGTIITLREIFSMVDDRSLSTVGLILFLIGLVILCIGFCGFCGICLKSRRLLLLYTISVTVIVVGLIILICFLILKKNGLKVRAQHFLKRYIKNDFGRIDAHGDSQSDLLDLMMAQFRCCGSVNGSDFNPADAPMWNRTFVLDYNDTVIKLKYPLNCCKLKEGKKYEPIDETCLTSPDDINSNIHRGCFPELWRLIDMYFNYTVYALIGVTVMLIMLFAFTVRIIAGSRDRRSITDFYRSSL